MLYSLALVLLCALALAALAQRLRLPRLVGMLLCGLLLGPYVLNLLSPDLLGLSADLRKMALVVILLRAGLSLDLDELRQVGRPALLMCFVPASCEIVGAVVLGPRLLGLSVVESAILGSVIAAVSPAVVVPGMLRLMEKGLGRRHHIPQLILAGASADDVFVLVLFTAFTGLAGGGSLSIGQFVGIPVSIVLGILVGAAVGVALVAFFRRLHMRDTVKVLIILSLSFLLVTAEDALSGTIPFSGLLAVMGMGAALRRRYPPLSERLAAKFGKIWVGAELMLFVLVGAAVDPAYVRAAGLSCVLLLAGALVFRACGVLLCLVRTPLSAKERLFCVIAYLPKATVQAAIGPLPLAMGLACGHTVLTAAVLAIVLTAPLGALGIDLSAPRLLTADGPADEQP